MNYIFLNSRILNLFSTEIQLLNPFIETLPSKNVSKIYVNSLTEGNSVTFM